MPGGEAPACPAGQLGAQIVSGLETQMLTSEGHALREGPAGGLGQQSESLPAEGAAVSEIWPTVCGQFVIF